MRKFFRTNNNGRVDEESPLLSAENRALPNPPVPLLKSKDEIDLEAIYQEIKNIDSFDEFITQLQANEPPFVVRHPCVTTSSITANLICILAICILSYIIYISRKELNGNIATYLMLAFCFVLCSIIPIIHAYILIKDGTMVRHQDNDWPISRYSRQQQEKIKHFFKLAGIIMPSANTKVHAELFIKMRSPEMKSGLEKRKNDQQKEALYLEKKIILFQDPERRQKNMLNSRELANLKNTIWAYLDKEKDHPITLLNSKQLKFNDYESIKEFLADKKNIDPEIIAAVFKNHSNPRMGYTFLMNAMTSADEMLKIASTPQTLALIFKSVFIENGILPDQQEREKLRQGFSEKLLERGDYFSQFAATDIDNSYLKYIFPYELELIKGMCKNTANASTSLVLS